MKNNFDQLTLSLRLQDDATFENFYVAGHQELLSSLKKLLLEEFGGFIYVWGGEGIGKSHLLQACCQYSFCLKKSSFYLPLNYNKEFTPAILEGIDEFEVVCIDNVEAIASLRDWEEALFHFYNRSFQKKISLIVSSHNLPNHLPFILPDLQSRLSAGITYHLKPLSDAEKIIALQLRAKTRGFMLPDEVGRYLINRYPRDMKRLFEVLEILDAASFKAQHRLTIPFIKMVLDQ